MIRLSNTKLKILLSVCFVTIALLVGLLFILPDGANTAAGEPDNVEHQRLRTAQISLNPFLSWELSLKGSGTEEVVETFVSGGYIYVFGNTDSADLDFDRAGIFLAVIDTFGVTKAFYIYGDEGDILRSASLCEGGFLLAIESASSPKLLVVDHMGLPKKTIGGFILGFERVLNVKFSYNGGYVLFTQAENNLTGVKTLRCSFFTTDLQFSGSNIAVSAYSLEFFDSVLAGGRAFAVCNAVSSLHTLPALVEFNLTQPVKTNILLGNPGEVVGLSLVDGDLLLLTTEGGSSLLTVSTAGSVKQKTALSQLTALGLTDVGGELAGVKGVAQRYLAFVDTATYLIDGSGNRKTTLTPFNPLDRVYFSDMVAYVGYGGNNSKTLLLNIYNDQKIVYEASLYQGENPVLAQDDNNMFCIYQHEGDVHIIKLRYPIFTT